MNTDKQVIVTTAEWPRKVGVVSGVEKLGFIHMAAQGMCHSVITKCTHSTVEHECVVVELHQILALRQLQNVNTPEENKKQKYPKYLVIWLIIRSLDAKGNNIKNPTCCIDAKHMLI